MNINIPTCPICLDVCTENQEIQRLTKHSDPFHASCLSELGQHTDRCPLDRGCLVDEVDRCFLAKMQELHGPHWGQSRPTWEQYVATALERSFFARCIRYLQLLRMGLLSCWMSILWLSPARYDFSSSETMRIAVFSFTAYEPIYLVVVLGVGCQLMRQVRRLPASERPLIERTHYYAEQTIMNIMLFLVLRLLQGSLAWSMGREGNERVVATVLVGLSGVTLFVNCLFRREFFYRFM